MDGEKGPVCVTGGTGFIGSWLIMRLLDHGYSVRATARLDPERKRDLSFLTSLPGASERLKIFNADLNDPESFGAAIEGCTGVFHIAFPVDYETKETEEEKTKRTVDGAVGVLKTCLDSKTVKRVIYISTAAALVYNGQDLDEIDESFWTDVDYLKSLKLVVGPYAILKTLTERAVLEFSEKHELEVVTLAPSLVIGPFICPKAPGSVQMVLDMVLDKKYGPSRMDLVHVDDVARAFIFLFEHPEAKGRYNCSANVITAESASELISTKYPRLKIPRKYSDDALKGFKKLAALSSKKLIDSGFQFKYGVEEMFDGAIKCYKEKSYL
ncbi:NAD(P)-binding domain containing protein [Parasponia andersonii]|uniref:NAD(P)-binding domain containing protein n=1 Tax=Parasponia andersonii TaxID=3476 RepID=A0A2P5BHV4_PARAD|nr:NAD(P)-binding domain containing protein [Parasponia andersonii]